MMRHLRLIFMTALFLPSLLPAGEALDGHFKLVFYVPSKSIQRIEKDFNCSFLQYNNMFVDSTQSELLLGLIIDNNEGLAFEHKAICINRKGIVIYKSQWLGNIYKIIGENAQVEYFDSTIYITDIKKYAFQLEKDGWKLVKNPLDKNTLHEKYRNINFEFLYDQPLYRISNESILTLDTTNVMRRYTREGKYLTSYDLKLPGDFFEDVLWRNPIIGIYGDNVFIWDRYINQSNLRTKAFYRYDLDSLFLAYNVGHIKQLAETMGATYFAAPDTFYILIYSEKGVFVFRYTD